MDLNTESSEGKFFCIFSLYLLNILLNLNVSLQDVIILFNDSKSILMRLSFLNPE